ncbi:MAG: hypothetical protein LBK59_06970 [Bifidobacteriaceae bacterium]|jgi:hypothetical protein|nr:hypothetical protein [Bifidobacteriaceae bacterium]
MRVPLVARPVWLAVGLIGAVVLAGCGQSVQQETGPAVETVGGIQEAGSDFVRGVLADGEVTVAEFTEAKEKTLACLADAGIDASYQPLDSSGQEFLTTSADVEFTQSQISADKECHTTWMGGILELYNSRLVNPDDEDMEVLTVACLVRTGLAPEGFTVSDLRELEERQSVEYGPDGSYEDALLEAQSRPGVTTDAAGQVWALLPSGVAMDDPTAQGCVSNPRGY